MFCKQITVSKCFGTLLTLFFTPCKITNMRRIDFSNCSKSDVVYSGAKEKIGIIFANTNYMLKFNGKGMYGEFYNDVSEYIGSEFFKTVGLEVQETILGTYKGRNVVACKDIFQNKKFKPFNELGDSSIEEKNRYSYTFSDIEKLITQSSKIISKDQIIQNFWKTYIIDALLANPDRHGRNWGFILEDGIYKICPIFDNGDSLFPKICDEDEYQNIIENDEEIKERVYQSPFSMVKANNGISTYFEVISSKEYDDCNKALIEIFPKINITCLNKIITSTDMPFKRKEMLIKIVNLRYEKILKKTYEELIENEKTN